MLNILHDMYLKIPVPRTPKIAFCLIYLCTMTGGIIAFCNLPTLLIAKLGTTLIDIFAIFCFVGSIICIVTVFACIRWLERSGIMLLITAIGMYTIMLVIVTGTTIALWLVIPLLIVLVEHFIELCRQDCNQEGTV